MTTSLTWDAKGNWQAAGQREQLTVEQPKAEVAASAYRTAETLLRHNRSKLVRGDRIRPNWIEGGRRFWYTVSTSAGRRFILVDPGAGLRRPAFDHARLAESLATATGQPVDAAALPFEAIDVDDDRAVSFWTNEGVHWRLDLATYEVTRTEGSPPPDFMEPASPDGAHAVFSRDHDLWVRGRDGVERQLTRDGGKDHEYGESPFVPLALLNKLGLTGLPPMVAWSPDSTKVLTHLTDLRRVREVHHVQAVPADGSEPRLVTQRYAYPGDEHLPLGHYVVVDVATGRVVPAQADPVHVPLMSPIAIRWAWWADDSSAVYYLRQSRDVRTLQLERLDPRTGEVTVLIRESGHTRVEPAHQQGQLPMVKVLSTGEVLWYSQRDGWGHLYLYGRSPCVRLTSGEFAVQQILHVDEAARVVYFTATGLVADDPYRRTVCRVGLDGSGFSRVTVDDLDHAVTVPDNPEDNPYFIDTASTTGTAPLISVRGWDGRLLVELERADISALVATGWSAPARFKVKAADGVTDVYGVLYKPHDFDPRRSYPVIDHPYPGPHIQRVSPAFDPGLLGTDAEALAAIGFVVIAMDGRGTPCRDKAFHDFSYKNYECAGGLVDHVAGMRQLAASRPWMDLNRVGVFGLSGGGFATVRAMIDFPDFYKVAVADAGNHDDRYYHAGWAETYEGPASEEDYVRSSNVEGADRIVGKLLLIHGGNDDNVHAHLTLRLVERLIQLDKDFEMLIVPGAEHTFWGYEHHVYRRRWDFFVRHLLNVEPPKGVRLTPAPIDGELIAELFG
ncbi:S9 family peptidase [Nonomuraea longicatena]|uniref:DPP IV N-terminal domain-containing protein n=1 Tax=Nonomuraea longicatena TaxID=83682 RepID=A0ABP3Z843_9ACTN